MPVTQYSRESPLYLTPQTTWFLSNYVDRGLNYDNNDTLMVLPSKYNLRPDLLSYDLYGTVGYRWTFMMINPDVIKDPIYDFVTGITIYVASLNRLQSTLGS